MASALIVARAAKRASNVGLRDGAAVGCGERVGAVVEVGIAVFVGAIVVGGACVRVGAVDPTATRAVVRAGRTVEVGAVGPRVAAMITPIRPTATMMLNASKPRRFARGDISGKEATTVVGSSG